MPARKYLKMLPKKMQTDKRRAAEKAGRRGEIIAAWLYRLSGYRVLEQRFKTKIGEIDLIARKKDVIVFIEVKHRPTLDAGVYSVTNSQSARIDGAANLYMARIRAGEHLERRNDIVVTGARFWPHIIKDAWR